MTAKYMERMMYLYHLGKLHIGNLSYFCGIITHERINNEIAAQSLAIFIVRGLVELERSQQDFSIILKKRQFLNKKENIEALKKHLKAYKNLINLMASQVFVRVCRLEKSFPEGLAKKSPLTIFMT